MGDGADVTVQAKAKNAVHEIIKLTGGRGADVVIDATGNPEVGLRNLKDDLETSMIQYSKPLDLGELMDMEQADAGLTLN